MRTSPAGHAMPPQPGPASTFSRTPDVRPGTLIIVSSSEVVVGGRGGARASNVGRAVEELEESEEGDGGETDLIMFHQRLISR